MTLIADETTSVTKFVVATFPRIVSTFSVFTFAKIRVPIDNVSVGFKFDIPDGAGPEVRIAFIWTLLFMVTGVKVPGLIVSKPPTFIPPVPTVSLCVYIFPVE